MDPRIRIRIHTKMSWIRNTGHRDNLRKIGIHLVKVRAPGILFPSSLLDPERIRIFLIKFKNLFMMNFVKGCSKNFPEVKKMYTVHFLCYKGPVSQIFLVPFLQTTSPQHLIQKLCSFRTGYVFEFSLWILPRYLIRDRCQVRLGREKIL